ncbi:class D beta-lactamase [Sinomicrobium weinanense]|uniref:beta-lactamase n=1 Tax=Sinomicrobium weinanense TaxID=2842200 RepID=A0A926JPH3_9FLAO|nr:class D beta-lactamase [Sinomicrobium weinanense]MBC9794892.1 class D beta-lactamase [Sinomicrobium weinanense]MBU3125663.1 penicillin binding protein transpeptidase domain-containing protein [Sinomicrobium weinanense]
MKKATFISAILIFSFIKLFGQQDITKPFKDCGIKGSITLYDYNAKKWITSDIDDSQFPTLPASTFKVINTLIALESGVISDENEIIDWPGTTDTIKYGYRPEIYHDISIKEAFKVSAGWAYIELAKKIGKEKYKEYLTQCNYGNVDLSINDDDFWNFGNFAISPANQIKILIGVYEETLPFEKKYFRILKNIMIEEQTENYTLRAKTGWTRDGGKDTGWWVGYVERDDNVYFFATRLIKNRDEPNPDFNKCRKKITKDVLRQLNVLGK